mmetsp:Transcript_4266/g.8636  ORF Transcript_4266/g.8636 Transcript_4266/m.8636 type:complete len:113 (+) Transcript_4266:472-810(+)
MKNVLILVLENANMKIGRKSAFLLRGCRLPCLLMVSLNQQASMLKANLIDEFYGKNNCSVFCPKQQVTIIENDTDRIGSNYVITDPSPKRIIRSRTHTILLPVMLQVKRHFT